MGRMGDLWIVSGGFFRFFFLTDCTIVSIKDLFIIIIDFFFLFFAFFLFSMISIKES